VERCARRLPNEIVVKTGTPVRCNRCDAKCAWPKADTVAYWAGGHVYRLQDMALLDCGHLDAHWVYWHDLQTDGGAA